jgi:hypothetical protein
MSAETALLLASVPYALRAADADTLGGRPASAYVLADAPPAGPPFASGDKLLTTTVGTNPPTTTVGTNPRSLSATIGTEGHLAMFVNPTDLGDSVVSQLGPRIGVGTLSPADYLHVAFNDPFGAFAGIAVQNLSSSANASSGMMFYDHRGALTQFQGFNNLSHEYRINNIAPGGSINFLLGSNSKFFVSPTGSIGIGVTAPSSTLDVAGDVNLTGALRARGAAVLRVSDGTSPVIGNNIGLGNSALNQVTTDTFNTGLGYTVSPCTALMPSLAP